MKKLIILFLLFPCFLFSQVNPSRIERIADIATVFGTSLSYGTLLEVQSTNKTYKIINVNGVAATAKFSNLVLNTDYIEVGSVTSLSIAAANNGVTASWSMGSPTPALTIGLGAITPTSVNGVTLSGSSTPTLAVTGTTAVSGTNTGDQTITLTSDVTGSGTGSFATTIANNAVTNAKFRQGVALSVVGVTGNATANVADIAATAASGAVLRESGSTIGFGTIATAGIANNAITYSKMQAMTTNKLLGSGTGIAVAEIALGTGLSYTGTTLNTVNNGTVTSVTSADANATMATTTTTPVITIVSAPKFTTARTIAGTSFDGSANISLANNFIVQGTTDVGLTGAQFLGTLGTGIVKNTTTTGVLSIAVAGDFPILNQNTTGTANIAGGTVGAIPYQSAANTTTILAATATANKILLSGASAAPVWSTPTFPNASAAARKKIVSDGTNWVASTETWAVPGTSGNLLQSDGTNWTAIAVPTWNQNTTGTSANVTGIVAPANGGTGVANASGSTITLGGALVTSGAFATTLTSTATTSVTLPTSGTLYGTQTGSITSAQLLNSLTDPTGTGSAVFGTTPTISTPVINGISTGTGVSTTAAANTLSLRDANANITANNALLGFTSTATAGSTTTLTNASTQMQHFTGTLSQTILLPGPGTVLGQTFSIDNEGTGILTIQSSGSNLVQTLKANEYCDLTCVAAGGTTAAAWDVHYVAFGSTTQASPTNPTGAGTTAKMQGLAQAMTPVRSGNILIIISGDIANNTSGSGGAVQLYYGTGTAPLNGATVTGAAAGGLVGVSRVAANNAYVPFSVNAIVSGLTPFTAYWIDLSMIAITGGTASITNLSVSIVEL